VIRTYLRFKFSGMWHCDIYPTTQCHVPEHSNLQQHCCENLKRTHCFISNASIFTVRVPGSTHLTVISNDVQYYITSSNMGSG